MSVFEGITFDHIILCFTETNWSLSLNQIYIACYFCYFLTPGLYQGDIVLNPEQRKLVDQREHAFGSITNKRWPNGIIPYYIDNSIREYE